jgi:hypothetical protein
MANIKRHRFGYSIKVLTDQIELLETELDILVRIFGNSSNKVSLINKALMMRMRCQIINLKDAKKTLENN